MNKDSETGSAAEKKTIDEIINDCKVELIIAAGNLNRTADREDSERNRVNYGVAITAGRVLRKLGVEARMPAYIDDYGYLRIAEVSIDGKVTQYVAETSSDDAAADPEKTRCRRICETPTRDENHGTGAERNARTGTIRPREAVADNGNAELRERINNARTNVQLDMLLAEERRATPRPLTSAEFGEELLRAEREAVARVWRRHEAKLMDDRGQASHPRTEP